MNVVAGAPRTRDRLLAAARELIEEGGYGSAPVAAIAERAGVAAGTLYRHFPSKAELFLEVFRAVCAGEERAMLSAADAVPGNVGAVGRLEAVLATFAERALRNPRLAWALLAEPVDRLVDAERLAYRERYAALVARELRAAIEAGEIPDQDAAFTAAALVGGCGEALVGPLSPGVASGSSSSGPAALGPASSGPASSRPAGEVVGAIRVFVRRAIGAA